MNILFITDIVPYPPNTGIKIRTYNIIKQLFLSKHNVYLFAFNHRIFINNNDIEREYKNKLLEICKEVNIYEIETEKNLLSKYFTYIKAVFGVLPYRTYRYKCKKCFDDINKLLTMTKIDCVHLDKVELYNYSSNFFSIPIFVTNHNIESDLMRQRAKKEYNIFRQLFAYLQWIKTEKYEKYVLSEANGFITCSENDEKYFTKKMQINTPAITVPNGVDCKHYTPSTAIDEGYFLIIGAQNKESTANYDATLYFFNSIYPLIEGENIKIKIVGRNPDKSIISICNQYNKIDLIGFVEDEREVILKSRALIVPLRIGGGSRLKILTAFGLGKAVISTSKGAEGINCEDNLNIIIRDTPEEFANAIKKLKKSPEIAISIGRKARILAENNYDWQVIGKKIDEFYRSLVLY